MKKILLMVPMLHQGGFERVCIRTARLLQEQCEISILIFSGDDIAYDIKGLQIIDIRIPGRKGILAKINNVWARIHKVKEIKQTMGIDITYSFGLTANLVNVFSKVQDQIWIGLRGFTDLSSQLHPILCKRADKIIACSATIQEIVQKAYPQKDIISIYNPYDICAMKMQADAYLTEKEEALFTGHQIILSMGREDEVKGFWHLIRSFAQLHAQMPQTRLMIIGEGEYEENKQFAEELGVEEEVFFIGVKKNPFPYLKRADVYALTSLHEGFPNALVEAMALGIPVVAANCRSGPAEILCEDYRTAVDDTLLYEAEYGILLPTLKEHKNLDPTVVEPEEAVLTEQIKRLLTQEALRTKYSKAGSERASQFSDEAYVDKLMQNMLK
ncbi:MAG: glycosyltransferase [Lachnospiraceae bacterium]